MINNLLKEIKTIYIAYGSTDFRKQIYSLCSIVQNQYKMNPKILCYDKNGFILAQKSLLEKEKMKFKWPKTPVELKNITKQQLDWLLSGLQIEYKNSFRDIELNLENTAN